MAALLVAARDCRLSDDDREEGRSGRDGVVALSFVVD